MRAWTTVVLTLVCLGAFPFEAPAQTNPRLERHGAATQLIVDGKPFLVLAAELHNSSSSSLETMRSLWPRLADIPLNTVLTPLSWELIEPREGEFDFSLLDGLIQDARRNHLHLVFLWFGSWKNGMSSYAPVWVKENTERFPRAMDKGGHPLEILSTFGQQTRDADARAFAAVMRRIRDVDGEAHTVVMMQVENEVGVLGDARDRCPAANRAFEGKVPQELTAYLQQNREALIPEFRQVWEAAGSRTDGTWREVFGPNPRADQIFMAWNYGRYVHHVAAAGKAEYPIPMYANTWLAGPHTPPGQYPSGGPLPEVMDLWKAAGSALDIYSPDIYAPDFAGWCDGYDRAGNPMFIPETEGGAVGAANVFYAVGQRHALGFSPFGIDSWTDKDNDLGKSYTLLMSMSSLILAHQATGEIAGFLLDQSKPETSFKMNGYRLSVSLDEIFGDKAKTGYGLVMAMGANQFLGAGSGFRVSFSPQDSASAHGGIAGIEEGRFSDGVWVPGRRLNGDENDQGRFWRFAPQQINVEKVAVYKY